MKLLKSKKALSPVVAAIILIAVTVAVSIAVAAWMGALTFSFMGGTETIDVKHITWSTADTSSFVIEFKNTGTSAVTIDRVTVNQVSKTTNATLPEAVTAGTRKYYLVTFTWTAGDNYDIAVVTSKGNAFTKRVTGGVNY